MAKYVAFEWMDALGEFPQWAINDACREYRNSKREWKPLPGQIRHLAIQAIGGQWDEYQRLKDLNQLQESDRPVARNEEWKKPTDEQKAKVKDIMKNLVTVSKF